MAKSCMWAVRTEMMKGNISQVNLNNHSIDLDVKRLAEPKRLTPAKEMHLVWMENEENGRKSIGQFKTSSGLFSGTLNSSLKTESTFKPTGFFITAEDDANIQYPVVQTVLSTG